MFWEKVRDGADALPWALLHAKGLSYRVPHQGGAGQRGQLHETGPGFEVVAQRSGNECNLDAQRRVADLVREPRRIREAATRLRCPSLTLVDVAEQ